MKFSKKKIFLFLFLLGLFVIFFVGRKFDIDTGKRSIILTMDGINHFRKGLDVSGGTKLVYKVSYDKYNEIYTNPEELNSIKKLIENIVIKNIDKRISKLGVSDYKAYVQTLDQQQYIVVEIGGIANLDQAKEIIGKTVELEFRLPNKEEPTSTTIQERKEKAIALLEEVKVSPDIMNKFADGRGAEGIFYNNFTGVTLEQLPEIYKNNLKLFNSTQTGEVSSLFEGLYTISEVADESGLPIKNEIKGFSFFRILNKTTEIKNIILAEDVLQIANQLGLKSEKEFSSQSEKTGKNTYEFQGKDFVFNLGEIANGQKAYDVKIFSITKPSALGVSSGKLIEMEEATNLIIEEIKNNISEKGFDYLSGSKNIQDGRLSETDIKKTITNFNPNQEEEIQTYKNFNTTYIVYIRSKKSESEKLYSTIRVFDVNKDTFESDLKNKIIYDLEDVFVQDKETRILALSNKTNKILNGAYFKFANVSSSQLGQPVVMINFDEDGKEIFCDITETNIGSQMAIFVGGNLLTAPTIQSKICGGGAQIDGQFTPETAKELVNSLNDGALPAPLVLMQEGKIDPTLGDNAFSGALIAALGGILLIFVYMYFVYGIKKAIVSISTLFVFLVLLSAILKILDYALSLSGIAAIILSLGMAVDANVLIFERFREETKEGKSTGSAIELAVSKSRSAIRDGQLSTGVIAFILFSMGINIFKGFGSMMLVTIVLTLFVNVPVTKELLKKMYIKK